MTSPRLRSLVRALARSLARPLYGGVGALLCLHRVIPPEEASHFPQNRALEITPDDLRGMLAWIRERGLEPISLDQIPERLAARHRPKFICFILDDGGRDNLLHALPVFREFATPFTVSVTNGFVAGTVSVWWYFLEEALTADRRLRFRWANEDYEFLSDTPAVRSRAHDEIASLVRGLGVRRDELIQRIAEAAHLDPLASTRRISMTWDEVRELAADPLVTIGAHTASHHSLNRLTDDEVRVEVQEARLELAAQIGRPVSHFAYPFGGRNAVNAREFDLVRSYGFTTMMTTRNGNLFREHAGLLDRLPRLGVSGNYPAVDTLNTVESGVSSALQWRFQRVIGE